MRRRGPLSTHKWIKECLYRQGKTFSHLAREAGVSCSTVYSVSRGVARSSRIEQIIADAIRYPPAEIWLDRDTEPKEGVHGG